MLLLKELFQHKLFLPETCKNKFKTDQGEKGLKSDFSSSLKPK